MTLVESSEFIRHKRSLDVLARQSPGYVYLISRFDDDDGTICTFGSMGYRDNPIKTGIGGVALVTLAGMKQQRRIQPADRLRGPFIQGSQPVLGTLRVIENPQQGGGHAEELFLRKLPQMFDNMARQVRLIFSFPKSRAPQHPLIGYCPLQTVFYCFRRVAPIS